MSCLLFECVKAQRITETHKRVVRVDSLRPEEAFRFRGLLTNAGYRFQVGQVGGKAAFQIWTLEWGT